MDSSVAIPLARCIGFASAAILLSVLATLRHQRTDLAQGITLQSPICSSTVAPSEIRSLK